MTENKYRNALIEAIGLYQGWEESAIKIVDECILPVLEKVDVIEPTDKTQELIKQIDKALNNNINSDDMEWRISDIGRLEAQTILKDCKAQLTAQDVEIKRLREGLKEIMLYWNGDTNETEMLDALNNIEDIAKQLLNEGV